MQLNKLHWKTYYCIYQAVPHTVSVSVSKCPKLHSYKNINGRKRDLVSTEELYCMVVTHAPMVNPCWDFAQESKWPEIKHHRQSTRLVCNIFGTSLRVLLAFFSTYRLKVQLWREWQWLMRNGKFCTTRMSNSLQQVDIHILWLIFSLQEQGE